MATIQSRSYAAAREGASKYLRDTGVRLGLCGSTLPSQVYSQAALWTMRYAPELACARYEAIWTQGARAWGWRAIDVDLQTSTPFHALAMNIEEGYARMNTNLQHTGSQLSPPLP